MIANSFEHFETFHLKYLMKNKFALAAINSSKVITDKNEHKTIK